MAKFQYKNQMYNFLDKNRPNIYADAKAEAAKIGVPEIAEMLKKEGRGTFGLTGGVSGCPAPLRDDILEFSHKESKAVKGLAGYVDELRYMVKDFYGAEYDVCPTATCEAGINVCYTSMFMPPVMGAGDAYRARYIAPMEKHFHHQGGYGKPFPPRYKDIIANRGCTAGELGMQGKRQPNLDTVVMPLKGANYDMHGIQYYPCPLLTGVKGEPNREVVEATAARHGFMLSGITSLGYDTPGYGYGDHDKNGGPVLQRIYAETAHKYGVPYVIDCAWGLPFVGNDIRKSGADAIVYSMDKATGSSICGMIIGKEDIMINARRAMGFHSSRYNGLTAYGKAVSVAFDPGKEGLLGALGAMKVLKDKPEIMTKPVDDLYNIIIEESKALDPAIKDGFLFTKSYNSCAIEINYEGTWANGKMGVPIFSIEDMYGGSNIFQDGIGAMGMIPTIAYDGNIYVSTGLNTLDDAGKIREDVARVAIKSLFALINITSKYAGVCE